jgi:hypothetical protein
VTNVIVSIDGVKIPDIKSFRVQSPMYDLLLPQNDVFGLTPGSTKSVADGYWIILKPLPLRKHQISFGGSSLDITSTGIQNLLPQ